MSFSNQKVIIEGQNLGLYFKNKRRQTLIQTQKFWAIKDISFKLKKGDCLGIIGKNGAGKSTLMQLIAGLMRPDRGQLINPGYTVSLLAIGIGFVPQLTGRDNAIISGMLQGLTRKEILGKLDKIIEFSELGDFFEEPLFTYSSGMKARLGFSVAMESKADVILIDELLGVGDIQFKEKSAQEMRRFIGAGRTIVLTSHQISSIQELCGTTMWIHEGRTVQQGNTDKVIMAYEKKFGKKSKSRSKTQR